MLTYWLGSTSSDSGHLSTPALVQHELCLHVGQAVAGGLTQELGAVMDTPEAQGGCVEQRLAILLRLGRGGGGGGGGRGGEGILYMNMYLLYMYIHTYNHNLQ